MQSTAERAIQAVSQNIGGEVLAMRRTDRTDGEDAFAVLWAIPETPLSDRPGHTGRTREYGTHRVVISRTDERSMVVWGHYFGQNLSAAQDDYTQR